VQSFTIDKTELTPWSADSVGKGALRKGQTYVQCCMTSENTFVSENRWAAVR
jgi:hypothetical protein